MPKKPKIYIQDYEINGTVLKITTGSGTQYELSRESCTCKGFGFRRNCGHMKEAKEKGLLAQLKAKENKKVRVRSKSVPVVKLRKDAIRKFLEKNDVTFNEDTVNRIEGMVTQDSTPEKVLRMV